MKRKDHCFRCLDTGHIVKACKSDYLCKACNGKHNITICTSREKRLPERDQPRKLPNEEGKDKGAKSKECLTLVSTKNKCNILMITARGEVSNPERVERRTARIHRKSKNVHHQ